MTGHDLIGFRNRATGTLMPWAVATADGGMARHTPRCRIVVDDGSAGWAMVRDGLGMSWAPAWLGLDDLRTGRVVEVMCGARIPEIPLSVIKLDRRFTPQRTQVVLDWLAAAAPHWSPQTG